MKRLLAIEGGLSAEDLADDHVSVEAAQRILRRFAFKGFVRRERNRWVATPLLTGCPVVMTEGWP